MCSMHVGYYICPTGPMHLIQWVSGSEGENIVGRVNQQYARVCYVRVLVMMIQSQPSSLGSKGVCGKKNMTQDWVLFSSTIQLGLTLLCNQAHVYIRKYDIIDTSAFLPSLVRMPYKLQKAWLYFQLNTTKVVLYNSLSDISHIYSKKVTITIEFHTSPPCT